MTLFNFRRFKRRRSTLRPKGKFNRILPSELGKLLESTPEPSKRKAFQLELEAFSRLLSRYVAEKSQPRSIDWENISAPNLEQLVRYEDLPKCMESQALGKLAVLKLNGGLGSSMGLRGAKSALHVSDDSSFLDITIKQIEHLNATHHVDVPLILMTSYNTIDDTLQILRKYTAHHLRIKTFNQSRYPRILQDSLLPYPTTFNDDSNHWYPPGHGDLYTALLHSGILQQLIADGKEYIFVSDSDNLGAVVDPKILQFLASTGTEFLVEVTDKTNSDVKGASIVSYGGALRLLDLAQVPIDHVEDFKSMRQFINLNTNNLWINLKALSSLLQKGIPDLDIIAQSLVVDDTTSLLQLETAAGAAIKHFKSVAVRVQRDRFLPIRTCSDFLLIKSDIYYTEQGSLKISGTRQFNSLPVIKLGDCFKNIDEFKARFKSIPNIMELDHLTVTGDVYFGRNVTLCGTVIILANDGQRIDIPDNAMLENRLVCGDLRITEL